MLRILIIIHHLVKKKIFQKNWREIRVKKEKIDYRSNLRKSIHVILIERKVRVFVKGGGGGCVTLNQHKLTLWINTASGSQLKGHWRGGG